MHKLIFTLLIIVGFLQSCSTPSKVILPKELNESSALVIYKDLFLTINDSDNEPIIFVFNKQGEITHQSYVKNSFNWDWEALAYDGEKYLYIGDFGNNLNDRKDLRVFRVEMEEVMQKDSVVAEVINFNYPDQVKFPPAKADLYYDAEAMIVKGDEILIFTKNRTVPFNGISKVYSIPTTLGKYEAKYLYDIQLPATHWLEESITDAYYYEDELYLLTYSKLYCYKWQNDTWMKQKEWLHESISQKEGVAVDKKHIYITDEDNENFVDFMKIKGNFLYKMKKK